MNNNINFSTFIDHELETRVSSPKKRKQYSAVTPQYAPFIPPAASKNKLGKTLNAAGRDSGYSFI